MKNLKAMVIGAVACLIASGPAWSGTITGLNNTGGTAGGNATGWTVSGGSCPTGANNCSTGAAYNNTTAQVPFDSALVVPVGGQPGWYTTPLNVNDTSVWIAPSVRTTGVSDGLPVGTVRYSSPGMPTGGPMDFGVFNYQFTTTFTVNADTNVGINLFWWADGTLANPSGNDGTNTCAILLNGSCAATNSNNSLSAYNSTTGNAASISSGFNVGTNTLTFNVYNISRETGLRVDFSTTGSGGTVPEPAAMLLMGFGLAGIALLRRRK